MDLRFPKDCSFNDEDTYLGTDFQIKYRLADSII